MQKLKALKSKKGSSLVGAVAICAVLGIGIAGLLGASRNTVSQGFDSLADAELFLAAESGLHMLTGWVGKVTPSEIVAKAGSNSDLGKAGKLTIDGNTVALDIIASGNNWRLRSTAYQPNDAPGKLPYRKAVEWVIGKKSFEIPGYFVHDVTGVGDGITATVFDGPAHFNTPLTMLKTNNDNDASASRFKGTVTLFRYKLDGFGKPYRNNVGDLEPVSDFDENKKHKIIDNTNGNLYNRGIWLNGNPAATLDDFRRLFFDGTTYNPEASFRSAGITPNGRVDVLPHEARLTFGVDGVGPYYNISPPNPSEPNPIRYGRTEELTITTAYKLTIEHGKMAGNVTVSTDLGVDLYIDLSGGHLLYEGVTSVSTISSGGVKVGANPNTPTITGGSLGENILALYSGKDVYFTPGNNSNTWAITAQIFASCNTCQVFNDPLKKNNNGPIVNVIGSVVIGKWWDKTGNEGNNFIKLKHDERMLKAPSIDFYDENGDPFFTHILERSNWKETNTPL